MPDLNHPRTTLAVLACGCAAMAVRWFAFISRYSVNLLYWDQWGFYTPLFRGQGLVSLFRWQHGPIREGIGLITTAGLAKLTRWNSAADAIATGALIFAAMLCALALHYRLEGRIALSDLAVPLLFLTLFQWEALVVVPSLSYGAFPLLMIMLYCLALFVDNPWWRRVFLLGLNFLLIYTGFGVFMGILTILLFTLELLQRLRGRQAALPAAISLLLAVASAASFFVGYRFNAAIPNFGFSISYLAQYPIFVGLMLGAFWGLHTLILGQVLPVIAGVLVLGIVIGIFVHHALRLARTGLYSDRRSLVIVILIAFSLLFCLNTAVGRIPLGLRQAQVSRYLTLLIPGYFGCFLHLHGMRPTRVRQVALQGFLLMSVVGSLPVGITEAQVARIAEEKLSWKRCYLQFEDVAMCNQLTGTQIYPDIADLPQKLDYLKQHHLNLYLDAGT